MPTATFSQSVTIGGQSIAGQTSRSASQQIFGGPGADANTSPLAAGNAGSITTRTDNDTAVATLSAGHGIVTNDVVDVYWSTGIRRGMVATVSGNAVTVDLGSGDNMPALSTAVVVCKQTVISVSAVGDNVVAYTFLSTRRCSLHIQQSGGTSIVARELIANEPYLWKSGDGTANPLAGVTVGKLCVSNGDSANTASITYGMLVNA